MIQAGPAFGLMHQTWMILAVAGFGYLLGLSNYGIAEEEPADDANDGHPVRSPVSH